MKNVIISTCLLGCALVLSAACSDDDETPHVHGGVDSGAGGNGGGGNGGSGGVVDPHEIPDSGNTMCAELGTYCHAFDEGTGLGAECHEAGHTGDEAVCAEMYDECIAFCQSDAGHHEEDGGDAGHHASAVCEEIGHLCHDFDNGDSGLGHECHEVGHAGDEAACLAIQDDCVALCGGDAGHHEDDAGHSDAGDGG